jgi:hypothetical protein
MLAKIAHSFAVAELGYERFTSYLPPLILGSDINLPHYVGGLSPLDDSAEMFLGEPGTKVTHLINHYLNCEDIMGNDGAIYLSVLINLLQPSTPTYRVVVAKLSS